MARRNNGPRTRWYPKSGVYYIVWSENGRSKERSTGTADRGLADKALADFIRNRQRQPGKLLRPSEVLITDVLDDYLKEGELLPVSAERAAYAVAALTPFWTGKTVQDINKFSCKSYSDARNRAVGTIRKDLGVLRAAVNHAVDSQRLKRGIKVFLPKEPKSKDRWLTVQEAAALLRATLRLSKARPYMPLFILIALHSGQRKQAILGLTWDQVDVKRSRIDWGKADTAASNKRRPHARIPRRLIPHLRRAYLRRGAYKYVLNIDGRKIGDIKKSFETACEKAGLEGVTPHTLRHTRATWGMQAGANKWELAGFLGMTLETLENVYGHHHPDYQSEGADNYRAGKPGNGGSDDDGWE